MSVIPFRRLRRFSLKPLLGFGLLLLLGALVVAGGDVSVLASRKSINLGPETIEAWKHQVFFGNCDEARAAGVAPIRIGQPGYAPWLDADRDGIACEPWWTRRGNFWAH